MSLSACVFVCVYMRLCVMREEVSAYSSRLTTRILTIETNQVIIFVKTFAIILVVSQCKMPHGMYSTVHTYFLKVLYPFQPNWMRFDFETVILICTCNDFVCDSFVFLPAGSISEAFLINYETPIYLLVFKICIDFL